MRMKLLGASDVIQKPLELFLILTIFQGNRTKSLKVLSTDSWYFLSKVISKPVYLNERASFGGYPIFEWKFQITARDNFQNKRCVKLANQHVQWNLKFLIKNVGPFLFAWSGSELI